MGEKNIDLLSAPSWRLEFSMTGLIFVSYFFLGYYLGNGRTIGKSFFKLKVLPQNKETLELSAMESMIRSLCYTLSLFSGFFLFLLPVFRKDNLGLADILSGSSIVSESDASFSNASIEVQAQLEFNFEQEPLSEEMLTFLPKFKRPANKKSA